MQYAVLLYADVSPDAGPGDPTGTPARRPIRRSTTASASLARLWEAEHGTVEIRPVVRIRTPA